MKVGCKLTEQNLSQIDPHTSKANRDKHIEGINEAFNDFGINTCLRKVHFLAQLLHESAHLQATSEYGGSNASYAPWYGRGLIQLTLQQNYEAYGTFVGEDVYSTEENRKKLENNPHAAKSAGWYWNKKAELNDEADKNDLLTITYKVNGGFNGLKDRLKTLKNGIQIFSLQVSTEYKFCDSQIYDIYKASLAWGLWHDSGSNKFSSQHCDASIESAKEGYNRFLALVQEKNIEFPIHESNGNVKKFYGHNNPKTYVEGRLEVL